MKLKTTLSLILLLLVTFTASAQRAERWSVEKANNWWSNNGWVSGCNYIPADAINQIEMWHSSTFNPAQIDKELGWAEGMGFTAMRVYLSSLVWQDEPKTFKKNMNKYLEIAAKHNIKTIFVFFDDCWREESQIGVQPAPQLGEHNSGWVQDPCKKFRDNTEESMPILEAYVKDVLKSFADDERILLWDLYNEPGNRGHGETSLPLLKKVFAWAWEVNPSQPLSSGVWTNNPKSGIYVLQLTASDVITYHNYSALDKHEANVKLLKGLNRPMICTEYMSRKSGSTFANILPMLRAENVGAINWGFVSGKTNTIFSWDERLPYVSEPELWFHDIIRKDGSAFDDKEVELIREINAK